MDSNVCVWKACAFSMEVIEAGGECRNCSIMTINQKKSFCSNCDLDVTVRDKESAVNLTPKKECSLESSALLRAKAWREKVRRDKLNDRFADLYSILAPGNFRKCNKIAILSCATRLIKQLKFEARKLKDKNISLQERIKVLKGEKMELRKEKVMLKAKKEKMEEMIKKMNIPSTSEPQFFFTATGQGNVRPYMYSTSYTPPTCQWVPVTQDHALRRPVS